MGKAIPVGITAAAATITAADDTDREFTDRLREVLGDVEGYDESEST